MGRTEVEVVMLEAASREKGEGGAHTQARETVRGVWRAGKEGNGQESADEEG